MTAQYTSLLGAEHMKHEAVIVKGDPRAIVLECAQANQSRIADDFRYAEKYRPAAIVMGSRGLGLLKRYYNGCIALLMIIID